MAQMQPGLTNPALRPDYLKVCIQWLQQKESLLQAERSAWQALPPSLHQAARTEVCCHFSLLCFMSGRCTAARPLLQLLQGQYMVLKLGAARLGMATVQMSTECVPMSIGCHMQEIESELHSTAIMMSAVMTTMQKGSVVNVV